MGEFLVLAGTFLSHRWWAVVATGGVVLAALYLLWAYQQAFHHEPDEATATVRDLTWREVAVVAPLIALILVLGVYPKPVLDRITPSVTRLVRHGGDDHGHPPADRGHPGPAADRGSATAPAREECRDDPRGHAGPDRSQDRLPVDPPVLVMMGGAVAILAASSLQRRRMDPTVATVLAVMTTLAALSLSLVQSFERRQPRGPCVHERHGGGRLQLPGGGARVESAALLSALVGDGWMRREKATGPEFQALMLLSRLGGDDHGRGQRPHRRLLGPRDPVHRPLRARR